MIENNINPIDYNNKTLDIMKSDINSKNISFEQKTQVNNFINCLSEILPIKITYINEKQLKELGISLIQHTQISKDRLDLHYSEIDRNILYHNYLIEVIPLKRVILYQIKEINGYADNKDDLSILTCPNCTNAISVIIRNNNKLVVSHNNINLIDIPFRDIDKEELTKKELYDKQVRHNIDNDEYTF